LNDFVSFEGWSFMHARETILTRQTGDYAVNDDLNPMLVQIPVVRLPASKLSFQAAFLFIRNSGIKQAIC